MHHNHINRDGLFIDAKLTKAAAMTMHNDPGFSAKISGSAYATPLFVDAGAVPALNAGKSTLFVATEANIVYALDAVTGAEVWHQTLGQPGAPGVTVNLGAIKSQGITGTPVIDLAKSVIIMDTAQGPGTITDHVIYGLDLATGKTNWQFSLSTVKDAKGNKFNASQQLQRAAGLIVNGYAYFGYGGNIGDRGTYSGWVVGVPTDGNMANVKAWRPDSSKAAVWGPGGPASDGNAIYVTTGNGAGGTSWAGSEGVIRLGFDLSFTKNPMDYYAPSDWPNLDAHDIDISGSGPLIIDTASSKLVLALGKSGTAYLIDRTNMGGVNGTIPDQQMVSNGAISNAAAWANVGGTVYVVANNSWTGGSGCATATGDLFAISIDSSSKMTEVWCGNSGGHTSPIITSPDGMSDFVVWIGGGNDGAGGGATGDGKLHAYDLVSGAAIANTASIPGMAALSSTLVAAGGRIYAASNSGTVYAVTP
jgi:hypothetical protein